MNLAIFTCSGTSFNERCNAKKQMSPKRWNRTKNDFSVFMDIFCNFYLYNAIQGEMQKTYRLSKKLDQKHFTEGNYWGLKTYILHWQSLTTFMF